MTNAERLELDTPYGWHTFVPLHGRIHLGTIWRCTRCHHHTPTPAEYRNHMPERCLGMLDAIEATTSEPHEPPPPPGRLF